MSLLRGAAVPCPIGLSGTGVLVASQNLTRSVRRVVFSDDTAAGRRKTAGGGGNAGIDTGISSGGGGGGGGTNQTPAMGDGGAWPADAPWSRFRY